MQEYSLTQSPCRRASLALDCLLDGRGADSPTPRSPAKGELGAANKATAEELTNKLIGVEGKLLQLKLTERGEDDVRWAPMLLQKISYLAAQVGNSSDFPPTTQQVAVHEELKQQADKCRQELQELLAKDVAAFNALLRERNIPSIITKTP